MPLTAEQATAQLANIATPDELRALIAQLCQATSRTDPLTTLSFDPRLMISSLLLRCSRWPG